MISRLFRPFYNVLYDFEVISLFYTINWDDKTFKDSYTNLIIRFPLILYHFPITNLNFRQTSPSSSPLLFPQARKTYLMFSSSSKSALKLKASRGIFGGEAKDRIGTKRKKNIISRTAFHVNPLARSEGFVAQSRLN